MSTKNQEYPAGIDQRDVRDIVADIFNKERESFESIHIRRPTLDVGITGNALVYPFEPTASSKSDSTKGNPLKVQQFPMCCTGKVINNIGGTHVTSGRHDKSGRDKFEEHLREKVEFIKATGNAFAVLTLNDQQKDVEKIVEKVGFKSNGKWLKKSNHKHTKVKLFWIELNEK